MTKDNYKKTMISNLDTLPEAIKTKEELILKEKREYDEIKYRKDLYELDVERMVRLESDPDGKKKYTNDILRKSEVGRRLKDDQQYQNLILELQASKLSIDTENINLTFLSNRLRSLIAVSRIMGD